MKHWKAKIYGLVQGVGYRWFALDEAKKLGIVGYTRNMFDGTVEIDAQGDPGNMDKYLKKLHIGPGMGKVSKIELEHIGAKSDYSDFGVRF